MLRFSIILTYFDRESIENTFSSFLHFYKEYMDYEIILVVDSKCTSRGLRNLEHILQAYEGILPIKSVTYENPGITGAAPTHYGISVSTGEILLLTSAECMHMTNILQEVDKEFQADVNSVVFCACRNVTPSKQSKAFAEISFKEHEWYQHSVHSNRLLYFCCFVPRVLYERVGGFDTYYFDGLYFEDDDFRETLKSQNIPIIVRDDLVVFHQDHNRDYFVNAAALIARNKAYFCKKWNKVLP